MNYFILFSHIFLLYTSFWVQRCVIRQFLTYQVNYFDCVIFISGWLITIRIILFPFRSEGPPISSQKFLDFFVNCAFDIFKMFFMRNHFFDNECVGNNLFHDHEDSNGRDFPQWLEVNSWKDYRTNHQRPLFSWFSIRTSILLTIDAIWMYSLKCIKIRSSK